MLLLGKNKEISLGELTTMELQVTQQCPLKSSIPRSL